MEGFPQFAFFFYWIPTILCLALGVIAVNAGKMPGKFLLLSKQNQYLNILIQSCIPVMNILLVIALTVVNLDDD